MLETVEDLLELFTDEQLLEELARRGHNQVIDPLELTDAELNEIATEKETQCK